jgi:uncharacterized protein
MTASLPPTILIVPGLHGSGPEHWQSRWEATRGDCRRVEQESWEDPDPLAWVARIGVGGEGGRVVLVAHSLGCIAASRWALTAAPAARDRASALLVAPCDPEQPGACDAIRRFAPVDRRPLPLRSILIASGDDPYASLARSEGFAHGWGSRFIHAGALGHINARSGLGNWEFGQGVLNDLIAEQRAGARPAWA